MRASTLFILSLALLVGLGVAVAVKVSGILNPPPPAALPTPPSPPPPPNVVVSARNLMVGDAIGVGDVRVRPLRDEELTAYKAHPDRYLTPVVEAAQFRTVKTDVEADVPLTKDMLEPLGKPEPLHSRLLPMTRAIDLQLTRENSAAGLIQVGDWVDVYLNSDVGRTDQPGVSSPRTAILARNVLVVAKRGTLYRLYTYLGPGPIPYTLAANPFRAALIDFARNKGTLAIVPVSAAEKKRLDALKGEIEKYPEKVVALAMTPDTPEYKEEYDRVCAYHRGEATASDDDLLRAFGLKPLAPPYPPVQVEHYRGLDLHKMETFVDVNGTLMPTPLSAKQPAYVFQPPKAKTATERPPK